MMKVPHSIRLLFDAQRERNVDLKKRVDSILGNKRPEAWFYFSRLKEIESFALKVESGRFPRPDAIEDYFACTIVVPNQQEVGIAETLVKDLFLVESRRPPHDDRTTKPADSFRFDDLRYYVRWKPDPALPTPSFAGTVFEIQVKTFLQHAWSIATHDLIYKTDTVDWGKSRIAFQVKAMLEHAEISIREAESLSTSASLKKESKENSELKAIIDLLQELWGPPLLPKNIRALADNIRELLSALRMNVDQLRSVMLAEAAAGRGATVLNLSPYAAIVQSTIRIESERIAKMLGEQNSRFRIVIPSEVEFPPGTSIPDGPRVLQIRGG